MTSPPSEQNPAAWRLPDVLLPEWKESSDVMAWTGETAHVWRASLNLPPEELDRCSSLLTADERARAMRFFRDKDRHRFVAARGTLRSLLSRYLGLAPEEIAFTYNSHGKPLLAENPLYFNLTRRQNLALYAFARKPVGIDVEIEEAAADFQPLLPQLASTRERNLLETIPSSEQRQVFLHLWTRKEALLKAAGTGFRFPPTQIEVLTEFAEIGRNLLPGFDVFGKWTAFAPETDFLATLFASANCQVEWFDWRGD